MKKLTFYQWLHKQEPEFYKDENHAYNWFISVLMPNNIQHGGDCTKMPGSCMLCHVEQLLAEYREYYFTEKTESQWIMEN